MRSLSTDSTLRTNCCDQLRKDGALFLSVSQEPGSLFETLDSRYSWDLLGSFCRQGSGRGSCVGHHFLGASGLFLPPTNPRQKGPAFFTAHLFHLNTFLSTSLPHRFGQWQRGVYVHIGQGPCSLPHPTPQHSHSSLRGTSSSSTLKH